MNTIKIHLFITLLLFVHLEGAAQYDGSIPQVTTVTPNSAALFKMTQRPQGSYTGTTPIQIPLYEVWAGDLSVPVTLNYSNGGIRVEEIASWVGLGWSLSAGGRITRIMNWVPDDAAANGGMLHASLKPSGFPGTTPFVNYTAALSGGLDIEPDVFLFDCNGMSGKFFFDEEGSPHIVSQQSISIESRMINNVIEGWIITDQNGIKYYFGMDKEGTVNYVESTSVTYTGTVGASIPNPSSSYISTWHLTEINDLNEENEIRFTYVSQFSRFTTTSSSQMPVGLIGLDCNDWEGLNEEVLVTNETYEYLLSKIEGGSSVLQFASSANRLDMAGGRRLDEISLYDKNNVFLRKNRLHYDYFSSATPGPDELVKRLKLSSLTECGLILNDSLTHEFEYVESVNLPLRNSKSVDYWGYYNSITSNSTFIPNVEYNYLGNDYRFNNLADRRAYPGYSKANTLQKIIYPTGGTREFVYEGNQILLEESESHISPDFTNTTLQSFFEEAESSTGNYYIPVISKDFIVNSTNGYTDFAFYIIASGYWQTGLEVKIFRVIDPYTEFEVMSFFGEVDGVWELYNGNYRVEVYKASSVTVLAIECYWLEFNMSNTLVDRYGLVYSASNNNAGGIRVKEIRDYDPVSNKTNITSYSYNLFSNVDLTSGMLVSPIQLHAKEGVLIEIVPMLHLVVKATIHLSHILAVMWFIQRCVHLNKEMEILIEHTPSHMMDGQVM